MNNTAIFKKGIKLFIFLYILIGIYLLTDCIIRSVGSPSSYLLWFVMVMIFIASFGTFILAQVITFLHSFLYMLIAKRYLNQALAKAVTSILICIIVIIFYFMIMMVFEDFRNQFTFAENESLIEKAINILKQEYIVPSLVIISTIYLSIKYDE